MPVHSGPGLHQAPIARPGSAAAPLDPGARVAAKIAQRREELELSERELARLTGLNRGYIHLLLHGRGSHKDADGNQRPANPSLEAIYRLADALEVDAGYLVDHGRGVVEPEAK